MLAPLFALLYVGPEPFREGGPFNGIVLYSLAGALWSSWEDGITSLVDRKLIMVN